MSQHLNLPTGRNYTWHITAHTVTILPAEQPCTTAEFQAMAAKWQADPLEDVE